MNLLAIGNSHLATFQAACAAFVPDRGRVQYLPSSHVVNATEFFGGRTLSAQLKFQDAAPVEIRIHDPADTHLVIVGNGVFGHFAVFCPPPDYKLPCFVWDAEVAAACQSLASYAWSSRLVSRPLFRAVYGETVPHFLMRRRSLTVDFLRSFGKVTIFASPTPGASFFIRQSTCPDVAAYLRCGCLRSFKAHYRALIDEFLATLPVAVTVRYPTSEEDACGCTQDRFLLAEDLQVHADESYWTSRIASAIGAGYLS